MTVHMTDNGYFEFANDVFVGIWYERQGQIQVEVYGTPEADIAKHSDCVKLFEADEDDPDDVYSFLVKLGIEKDAAEILANKTCANILRAHGYEW